MGLHIDVDLTEMITGGLGLDAAAGRLQAAIDATVNGRLTWSEVLSHRESRLRRPG